MNQTCCKMIMVFCILVLTGTTGINLFAAQQLNPPSGVSQPIQAPLDVQKQPLLKPDLSCYFEQELNSGIRLWVQNNTSVKATYFDVHYEAVKDGVKVLDSVFNVNGGIPGNYKNYIVLIPCNPGQKFTATVDFRQNVVETNETNNTCTYTCKDLRHMIEPPVDININPAIPRTK